MINITRLAPGNFCSIRYNNMTGVRQSIGTAALQTPQFQPLVMKMKTDTCQIVGFRCGLPEFCRRFGTTYRSHLQGSRCPRRRLLGHFDYRRCDRYVVPKRRCETNLHSVTFQKTTEFRHLSVSGLITGINRSSLSGKPTSASLPTINAISTVVGVKTESSQWWMDFRKDTGNENWI
jgi:hypothetical protein